MKDRVVSPRSPEQHRTNGGAWPKVRRVLVLAFLLFLLGMFLRQFEHSQVYHPLQGLEISAESLGARCEDVFLQTRDGVRLNAWFFNAPAATASNRNSVVLLCHGNGGNISHRVDLYDVFLEANLSVFAFDYRGYGLSEGRPSEKGTYTDAAAALEWLTKRGFATADVVVVGESLGGGIASELASRNRVAGLVLLSSFTSIPDIGAELFPWLPVKWLSTISYDTRSRLPGIKSPVMVMHSRNDGLIGFQHAERNFAVANEPKLFWELQGTHNDPLHDREHFLAGINAFLRLIETNRAASPVGVPQ